MSTVSNALDISIATAIVLLGGFLALKPSEILVATGRRAVEVEWKGLNPCWDDAGSKDVVIEGNMSHSRTFIAGQSREMGLKDVP